MKKTLSFMLVGLVVVFSILACTVNINGDWDGGGTVRGSGTVVDENRELGDVSGVELAMQGTLYIVVGSSESLRIEAEENLLEYIQTDVRAGKLVIETRQGTNLHDTKPINYYLTVDELHKIVISSSGDIESEDLQADSISVVISSSGNLSTGNLDCTSLDVVISSSGGVTVSSLVAETISVNISSSGDLEIRGGDVQRQTIHISSSGEYRASDLASLEADVTLSSSGSVTIRVRDDLNGRLSSSGDINYIGDPDVNVTTTSSGRARQIKE